MSYQNPPAALTTREHAGRSVPGFIALAVIVVWLIAMLALLGASADQASDSRPEGLHAGFLFGLIGIVIGVFALFGFFTLQPNEARVLILFGNYRGTVRHSGFHWANPFFSRSRSTRGASQSNASTPVPLSQRDVARVVRAAVTPANSTKLSLRAHNFNSDTLKVNDKRGNPVEIAAVIVWRIADTAQAVFDVEDYGSYVQVQSESAIRSIASRFSYDQGEEQEPTLRGSAEEVAHALQEELAVRLTKAGVVVEEARLTHLAYAPEIASAMLRRQQAEAIVAARQRIVQGAVGMVSTALQELESQQVVQLDPERRAAMVSNMLVVLCGNADATPVINTGTLYT